MVVPMFPGSAMTPLRNLSGDKVAVNLAILAVDPETAPGRIVMSQIRQSPEHGLSTSIIDVAQQMKVVSRQILGEDGRHAETQRAVFKEANFVDLVLSLVGEICAQFARSEFVWEDDGVGLVLVVVLRDKLGISRPEVVGRSVQSLINVLVDPAGHRIFNAKFSSTAGIEARDAVAVLQNAIGHRTLSHRAPREYSGDVRTPDSMYGFVGTSKCSPAHSAFQLLYKYACDIVGWEVPGVVVLMV